MGAHPEEEGVVIATSPSHERDRGREHGHELDLEPDEAIANGEPRTPMWLPLVGGVVFVLGIVGFMATRPPGKTAAELQKEAAASAAELRAKREAERAPPPAPTVGQPRMPGMPGGMPNPSMPQPGRAPGRGG